MSIEDHSTDSKILHMDWRNPTTAHRFARCRQSEPNTQSGEAVDTRYVSFKR